MKINTDSKIKRKKTRRVKQESIHKSIKKNVDTLTVIIPTMCLTPQNWFNYLLGEMQKSDCVKEIIIINNSTDDMLKKYELPNKTTVFQMKENISINPAWNLGMRHCSTELYLILNDDVLCSRKIIDECCDTMKSDETIGVLSVLTDVSRTISPKEYSTWEFMGPRVLQEVYKGRAYNGWFMVGRTELWFPIHPSIKLLYGDDFILLYNKFVKKKKLLLLSSMKIIHWHQLTTVNDKNVKIHRNARLERRTYKDIYAKTTVDNIFPPQSSSTIIEKVNTMKDIIIKRMLYGVEGRYTELGKEFHKEKFIYVTNGHLGIDPVPGLVKHMVIECEYKNKQYSIKTKEGGFVNLEEIYEQIQDPNYLSIRQLFNDYKSDKSYAHGYDIPYSNFLSHRRFEKLRFLEIGLILGSNINEKDVGSLKVWEKYLPNAELFGIDINPKCLEYNSPRIKTAVADYRNKEQIIKTISEFGGEFDVIIDDADHEIVGQKTCFSLLWPFVKAGGFYAIEDINGELNSNWACEMHKQVIFSSPYSEISLHVYPHVLLMVKERK